MTEPPRRPDQAPPPPTSPCIRVCRIDPASGWCTGCLRSMAEIAAWRALGDDERRRILAELPGRTVTPTIG